EKAPAVVFFQPDLGGGGHVTEDLEFQVVLITPEVRHDRFLARQPEHVPGHHPRLLARIRPVFDATAAIRAEPRSHVAHRPHVRDAGTSALVAQHTVADLDPAAGQPAHFGHRADTDDHDIGL